MSQCQADWRSSPSCTASSMEAEQERARQLEIEFGQLQLELSTWATSPRIEKIAREKLKMRIPDPAKIVTVTAGGGR